MQKTTLIFGILFSLTAVIFGAFGAHKLKSILPPESLLSFETGVRYQMFHGLALILISILMNSHLHKLMNYSSILMIGGTILFSVSIYFLVLFKWKWLGPITPIGGLMLICGWVVLLVGVLRK